MSNSHTQFSSIIADLPFPSVYDKDDIHCYYHARSKQEIDEDYFLRKEYEYYDSNRSAPILIPKMFNKNFSQRSTSSHGLGKYLNPLEDDNILSNLSPTLVLTKNNQKKISNLCKLNSERINSFNKIFSSRILRIHNYFMNRNFENQKVKSSKPELLVFDPNLWTYGPV